MDSSWPYKRHSPIAYGPATRQAMHGFLPHIDMEIGSLCCAGGAGKVTPTLSGQRFRGTSAPENAVSALPITRLPRSESVGHPPHEVLQRAEALAAALADTAVARDKTGGHAPDARQRIRDSGLLTLTIARVLGGQGASWPVFYRVLRRLAEADSALAHVFGFHHLQLASISLFGSPAQEAAFHRATVQQGWFWGNALNPLDKRTSAQALPGGGFRLHGSKSYCSGSVGSDQLLASGWHAASQTPVYVVVPTTQPGITVESDWDAFGQRQTDSGSVHFAQVDVPAGAVIQPPGTVPTPRATLRTLVSQLILTNLYLGIARGAFAEAQQHIRTGKAWLLAGVPSAADDPYIQHRLAQLWLLIRPAEVLADEAATQLQQALDYGHAITADARGQVALAVIEAKALAHRAATEVSSQFFELTGARTTSEKLGLDRFWRNARVHTLHDPIDYKLRDLGRHLISGRLPDPTSYS